MPFPPSLLALPAGASDAPTFNQLFPIFAKANCRACHNAAGVASATRLHFPEGEIAPADLEAFGRSLAVLVDRAHPDASPLFLKPTNRVKHTGGKLIAPESPEEEVLLAWVRYLARTGPGVSAPPSAGKAAPALLRRLTHSQYNRTVRDLLGDQTGPAGQFPPEDFVNGFKNQADAQSIPALLAEAYGAAAENLARNAFRGGDLHRLVPCKPSPACRAQFVREFGLKAFRRPLSAKEVERYSGLMAKERDFVKGAQLVVEAMLQSPAFLFHAEARGPYQSASRLSYFLWDTMPDGALFRAAASGQLATPAGIEKEARRLLDDPRARSALDEFVGQWMRFDRVLTTIKDRRLFPMFNPELAAAMAEETRLLIADAVWNDRDFMSVFSAEHGFLSADLAGLYRFPVPPGEYARVNFPAASDRAGLLGQATFLSLTSKPEETSPTARGLFVREQFLCQHVPDPPPGINSNLPPLTEARPLTNRERLAGHLSQPMCATCHNLIDPIGFGLEKFDAIGARRERLKLTFLPGRKEAQRKPSTVELDLDTRGSIGGIPNSEFASPKELGRVLAASRQCQECVVKQVFRYGFGRLETPADKPLIQAVYERFRASGFRFREMLVALATASAAE
ncbi:MAG: DUF1592 domain-containing protein [Acidobacteria bacterium]|nr:DUF1592 domain-containing protein [Acidobacteriota bacterium]